MKMNLKEIGKKLLELRVNLGMAREEVANELGVSVSTLGMYEQGRRIPRDEIKIRIAELYKRSVQEIFFNN